VRGTDFPGRVLVVGLGLSGRAVARRLMADGAYVVAVEDQPRPSTRAEAAALGVELVPRPDRARLRALVG
jgi:UDP-N-acetylmuramoylalanine-D-glutamate ligase